MAHVAQAFVVVVLVSAVALWRLKRVRIVMRALYERPVVLWAATAILVPALLLLTGRWRFINWGGLEHFIAVAIAAFVMLIVLCEGYRLLRGDVPPHR